MIALENWDERTALRAHDGAAPLCPQAQARLVARPARYVLYMVRELTSLFVGVYCALLVVGLWRLAQGPAAWTHSWRLPRRLPTCGESTPKQKFCSYRHEPAREQPAGMTGSAPNCRRLDNLPLRDGAAPTINELWRNVSEAVRP
jgi:hypothetical protein